MKLLNWLWEHLPELTAPCAIAYALMVAFGRMI